MEREKYFVLLKQISEKKIEKQCISEFEANALGADLIIMLYDLLPKQADEVIRAIKANIPIMLINNSSEEIKDDLQTALRKAGAVILPPCILEDKKENISFLAIFLNKKTV